VKVALVTTSFPRAPSDDAGIFVARLVGALEQEGVQGVVITPRDRNEEYQPYKSFYTVRVPYTLIFRRILAFGSGILPNIKRNPWAVIQIPGLLYSFMGTLVRHRREYEVIHANWLINVIPSVCAGLILRKPVIVTARGEDLRLLRSKILQVIIKPFLTQVASIVVVGESLSDELGELLPALRTQVLTIENGVEPETPSEDTLQALGRKFSLNPATKYLVFVGSIIPRKGIEDTITIVSKLKDQGIELLLCGRLEHSEYVQRCKELAAKVGVAEREHFLGALPPSEVWGLLAMSTLFISSSEFEGRPNAILEALSVGLPVIASKIPAHESVVTSGYSGYLFSSTEDAAHEIDALLSDRESFIQLSQNARKSMAGRGWRAVASQYVAVYKRAVENSKVS
jgi:teichuronic acid biosynthesis glycosyltransferase TuaC